MQLKLRAKMENSCANVTIIKKKLKIEFGTIKKSTIPDTFLIIYRSITLLPGSFRPLGFAEKFPDKLSEPWTSDGLLYKVGTLVKLRLLL